MRTPFPGMDPYLEHPHLWPDVHNRLIAEIDTALSAALPERYYVALEERVYVSAPSETRLVGVDDVAIVGPTDGPAATQTEDGGVAVQVPMPDSMRETYLEVRDGDGRVITTIELLSPSNKTPGRGQSLYLEKRTDTLMMRTHLVEIDLLRGGARMPLTGADVPRDYGILISRGDRRPRARLHPFGVREAIPRVRIPLARDDEAPWLDLQTLLHDLYARARYGLRIDYGAAPVPPLEAPDAAWAAQLLTAAGLGAPPVDPE